VHTLNIPEPVKTNEETVSKSHEVLDFEHSHERFGRSPSILVSPASSFPTTMPCCGKPSPPRMSNSSKPLPQQSGAVGTQPGLQPMMMEKPTQFNHVSPPPQVHANAFNPNAPFQQPQTTGNQQQWHTTPSPPPRTTNDFGSFNTGASSTAFGPSTFNGSMLSGQTPYNTSPQASLLRSASPPASNMLYGQPKGAPQDEGKMSVSIDFGMSFRFQLLLPIAYCHFLGTTFSGVVSSRYP
jgi:hypothetical protein